MLFRSERKKRQYVLSSTVYARLVTASDSPSRTSMRSSHPILLLQLWALHDNSIQNLEPGLVVFTFDKNGLHVGDNPYPVYTGSLSSSSTELSASSFSNSGSYP